MVVFYLFEKKMYSNILQFTPQSSGNLKALAVSLCCTAIVVKDFFGRIYFCIPYYIFVVYLLVTKGFSFLHI